MEDKRRAATKLEIEAKKYRNISTNNVYNMNVL